MMKELSIAGAIAVVFSIFVFGVMVEPSDGVTGNAVKDSYEGSDFQEVSLSFKNYAYQLEPSTLTKGVPVKMIVDMNTVGGCMRDVVIPAFNVRKYVSKGDNVIEFVPTKSGTFNIACSMNMGRGTFTVEDGGEVSDFVEAAAEGGSCDGDSEGCGCGQ